MRASFDRCAVQLFRIEGDPRAVYQMSFGARKDVVSARYGYLLCTEKIMAHSSAAPSSRRPGAHEINLLVTLLRLSRVTLLYRETSSESSRLLRSNLVAQLQKTARQPEVIVLF